MTGLHSSVVPVGELDAGRRAVMLALMREVYEGVDAAAFERDLDAKDECILILTEDGELAGFSTQKLVHLDVDGRIVEGLFSGDVVVQPRHQGSAVLFQAFVQRYVVEHPQRWWFLVSKGERTYRLLPVFFTHFWPDRRRPTPPEAKVLMDAYARHLYPDDYDAATGVLAYRNAKDRLRPEHTRPEGSARTPDAAFFERVNPGWREGHDLVCLCELSPGNLRPQHRARLMGR